MMFDTKPDNPSDITRTGRQSRDPLRLRIGAVVVILTIIIIGLTSLNAYQIRAAALERASITTLNLSRLVERQVYDLLSKVDIALQTAALEIDRELGSGDPQSHARISDFLKRQHALLAEVAGYRVIDERGDIRYGNSLPVNEVVSVSDREYFQYLRTNPEAKVVVFGPIYTHISKQWSLGIARSLRDDQGHFRGAVTATISVNEFQQDLDLLNLGKYGAATIRMADMSLVARASPSSNGNAIDYGSRTTSPQLLAAISDNPDQGSYLAATALDGIERLNAYIKVSNYPLYVIVGVASKDVVPEWRNQTLFVLALGVIAIAITAIGATAITRQRRRDLRERLAEATRNAAMLRELAHHDALTGLPNRVLLQDRCEQAIAQHLRRKQMLAIAFLDLDGFKVINDTHGHEAGDALLIELAKRMKAALRDGDTLARLGGDEFVAIITDLGKAEDAQPILQRLLAACAAPVDLGALRVQVSVSIGVAVAPEHGTELGLLLRAADHAMYLAKQSGRNQFRYFEG